MDSSRLLQRLSGAGAFFTILVIALGALTRLVNAGLGCPDWPGCYGHIVVPAKHLAHLIYPKTPLVAYKAWAEMIHRYCAGALSFISVWVFSLLCYRKRFLLALSLLLLVLYQIALGRWTVTLQLLPVIVTQHLMGGMLIASLLWFIHLREKPQVRVVLRAFHPLAKAAFIVLLCQIALGAWTSTHYASLSCDGFPFCSLHTAMHWHLKEAFSLSPVGINYEGGVLPLIIRQTIHMTHRFGALFVGIYLLLFAGFVASKVHNARVQRVNIVMLGLLFLQITLGIANVLFQLPLGIAIAHTVTAVLLLLTIVSLNGMTYR